MIEYFNFALDQRKIKRVLNLIFVASIASFIFESSFFEYSIIDVTDLNNVYFFFIKGHFILPFVLFYFARLATAGLSTLLFKIPNVFILKKYGRTISEVVLWLFSPSGNLNSPEFILPKTKTLQWLVKAADPNKVSQVALRRRVIETHQELESDFTLILRAIIAISFYFNSLEYFGWGIYLLCISAFVSIYLLQVARYHFTENLPELIENHLTDKPKEVNN